MPDPGRSTTAGVVVAADGLPAARVAAESYLEHHPDHGFVVLVVDGPVVADRSAPYRVVGGDWLDVDRDHYLRMATCLGKDEFIAAVAPLLLRRLLAESSVAVHLAPDVQVFAPFDDLTGLAAQEDIVLAARHLAPLPRDGREPAAETGCFDRGFAAVGAGAKPFLDLWAERAMDPDPDRDLFDLVPGLFRHAVVRDPGVAVGYWNAHERGLDQVRFMRFSGYDPDSPWLLSADCARRPRVRLSENPRLEQLCQGYRERLLAAGHDGAGEGFYGFDRFPDGAPITKPMRELFHDTWTRALGPRPELAPPEEELPPHPFGEDGGRAFRAWLTAPDSPAERGAGLNRLAMWVWSSRVDLQSVFRAPLGADGPAYHDWCRSHGVAEGLIPVWALPSEPPPVAPPTPEFGVNVAGYLTAELGLGEMGRVINRVVEHAGVPTAAVVEERSLWRSCRTALEAPATEGAARFPVSVLAVNADYTRLLLDSHPEVGHQRYRIGLWAWELEDFPAHLHEGFALVDEVWTVSDFVRRAIAPHSPVPVVVVPVPVLDPGPPRRAPGGATRFLFAFDFNSTGQRKNPWGAVAAFQRAFPGREDVELVVKATNGHLHAAAVERLKHVIGGDRRITLMETYLSVEELDELYARSDAYVSLHRSEGFGLTVAEAMVRGLPVITTDYGGTTEFFHPDAGWAIPYRMVEVGPGWEPYQADGRWADPDLDAAAEAMRVVADHPEEARRRGAAAREHVLRTRSMDTAARWVRERLTAAHEAWRAGPRARQAPPARLGPLDRARRALTSSPDPGAPHRLPLAPVFRRALGRVMSHHDAHQREVLGEVVEATGEALAELERRHAARLAAVEQEFDGRLARLARRLDRPTGTGDER